MRIAKNLALIILLFIGSNIKAQDIQLTFHNLTEENGLTQASRYQLFKDSRGLIWIGTEDGLLQFDGLQIKKFQHEANVSGSLSENNITSRCFEDKEGNLWFTSFGAVNCFRRNSADFATYSFSSNLKNYYGFHFDENDKLWLRIGLGNDGALYFFDTVSKTFEQSIALEGEQCTVIKDKQGKVKQLLSTSLPTKSGLTCTDLKTGIKKDIAFLFTPEGRKRNFSSPTKSVLVDSDSIAWVGVYNGLGKYYINRFEGFVETKRVKTVDSDVGWVWDIAKYDENRLIIAADNGLLVFDKLKRTFVQQFRFDSADPYSLALKKVNNIYIDSTQNIWVSGPQQEIAFAHLKKNRIAQLKQTTGAFITSIVEDHQGNIWCSSLDSGTYVYNQNKELLLHSLSIKNPTYPNGYSNIPPLYFFLKDHQDQWWANVGNTYLIWNPLSKEFEFNSTYFLGIANKSSNRINYNYQRSNGQKLIAKGSNIYELQLSKAKADTLPWHNLKYLQLKTISILFEDKNKHIYIGDHQGRLVILKEQNNQVNKIADINDIGVCHAFKEDPTNNIIWIVTSKGLGKIDPVSFQFSPLEAAKNPLPKESFYNIEIDKRGQLWLSGNNGLIRYHPNTKNFHRFGTADGILSPVFSKNAMITASQSGEIWLGGKNGINVFKPEEVQLLAIKPDVQLSRFLVNDDAYEVEGNLNERKKMTFPYDKNTLSFEFVALDYSDPIANQFTCQMEGYDEAPIDNGSRNFIRYGNLPAGNYTFKVWGTNSDGIKNNKPFQLAIKIIPPFYQTWWFYLLCLIAVSGILYAIFKYRLEQALKVERLRVKISSDLHDDVGGLLSGLAMQTEVLELTANEAIKPKLHKIAALSRSAMSRMRDTVWAIDSRKDKMENLLDRMREHAEEVLTPKNIRYDIAVDRIDLKTNLPTDIRQNLYLIYKEAITNVAKHSNGSEVLVALKKVNTQFEMTIQDNGKVEEKNYKASGLGQSNMKLRAKQIKASLQTIRTNGFKIILRMKSFT